MFQKKLLKAAGFMEGDRVSQRTFWLANKGKYAIVDNEKLLFVKAPVKNAAQFVLEKGDGFGVVIKELKSQKFVDIWDVIH